MVEYEKPWLSVDEQISRLKEHGLEIKDDHRAALLLKAIGYYRLTGYLYPFRQSKPYADNESCTRMCILNSYQAGTTLDHAKDIIDFDRRLRMLVMDGVERIEIAVRMRIGYVLGKRSRFAHEDPACFTKAFTAEKTTQIPEPSKQVQWLQSVNKRKAHSDEQFVKHFQEKYDDRIPIWVLTEILELGHLSNLYRGMHQEDAEEIAQAFGVPTKKIMASWLASLNYVRNVAAHHSRLFNRKLQHAPKRPKHGEIPTLDHLQDSKTAKGTFGTYNALAIMAYLLRSIDQGTDWPEQMAVLLHDFPASHVLTIESMGAPQNWETLNLWRA
ncbi:MAG: Abi family protein [Kocuria sp.]|nr:Abi family protein [Kocuria sp.]